jgi:heme/copper-type cytochrome/quinol oxidase subunit 2
MKSPRKFLKAIFTAAALAAFTPSPLFACAACYGKSDSPLASGMNWGIFTLMGVILTVLASIATFFIYIVRKEAATHKNATLQPQSEI